MRNPIIPALLLAFALLFWPYTAAQAQDGLQGQPTAGQAGGGFSGPGIEPSTVRQALRLRDDSPVTLRGNIVRHLGGDNYLFRDSSGEIAIDIDHRRWQGLNVTPEDTVEISGEIDKDWDGTVVDVDSLIMLL
ncbi:MAG: YgiW/YdeI family stress tolerance OB fold protein [Deltaproteobacteria bacterium]|jgi:uncharacterized protein (TIGR00156 family)|nr:YgiW/YdeI family stress tolerance OB fold protein [Deltaproteobacteria bacterium]